MSNDWIDRDDPDLEKWAKAVKVNDDFTCQICNARGVYLEAHHKNGYNSFPNERLDLDNGVTLCKRCHERFHLMFGYGGNTKFQFEQYKEIANILKKLASKKDAPNFLSHTPDVETNKDSSK